MESKRSGVRVPLSTIAVGALLLSVFLAVWLFPGLLVARDTGAPVQAVAASLAQTESVSELAVGDRPHLTARGVGIISARPDVLNVQIGVQTQNVSLADAQWDAATRIDATLTQLREAGVEERDISTARYNIEPVMEYPRDQPPRQVGFRVSHMLNVRIRDVGKAGKLIDDVVKAGATSISSISFSFSDPTALINQARERAMNDSKTKAQQMASLGNVTLGAPLLIEEVGSNVQVRSTGFFSAPESTQPATAINPGEQEVRVEVSVLYPIK
ncbi:MAG TPA: SIMPL domain-containing protein [Chloroflexia bacterium]|nr:SIMPL domain-containing protein [Chloroflexia bacterium]